MIEKIGSGAVGSVNCYYDLEKKEQVAIKYISNKDEFTRER